MFYEDVIVQPGETLLRLSAAYGHSGDMKKPRRHPQLCPGEWKTAPDKMRLAQHCQHLGNQGQQAKQVAFAGHDIQKMSANPHTLRPERVRADSRSAMFGATSVV
jgi:hypothetical protein